MKRISLKIIIVLLTCISICYGQSATNLENTVWINDRLDDCTSEMRFKLHNECLLYYCDLDEIYSGKYYIKADTVIIKEYHLRSEMPGSNDEKEVRFIYKYLLDRGMLKLFYYQDLKYDYIEEGYDESFQYTMKH
jgi:hypothetical protein